MGAYTGNRLSAAAAIGAVEALEKERGALVRQREKVLSAVLLRSGHPWGNKFDPTRVEPEWKQA